MCLSQGPQRSDAVRLEPAAPLSRVKHSTTEPLCSLYQSLCVFSQMKDTKHIRRDFHSVAWVMPQGWNFGVLGMPKGSKFYFFRTWSCGISLICHMTMFEKIFDGDDEQNRTQLKFSPWWPWGEVKRSNTIKFQLQSQFQKYLYETLLWVFSQIKERKQIEQNFHSVASWVMPQGWDLRCWGSKT